MYIIQSFIFCINNGGAEWAHKREPTFVIEVTALFIKDSETIRLDELFCESSGSAFEVNLTAFEKHPHTK